MLQWRAGTLTTWGRCCSRSYLNTRVSYSVPVRRTASLWHSLSALWCQSEYVCSCLLSDAKIGIYVVVCSPIPRLTVRQFREGWASKCREMQRSGSREPSTTHCTYNGVWLLRIVYCGSPVAQDCPGEPSTSLLFVFYTFTSVRNIFNIILQYGSYLIFALQCVHAFWTKHKHAENYGWPIRYLTNLPICHTDIAV